MIRRSSGQVFFFKQKTAYEMRISDWSSDVCSSDLQTLELLRVATGQKSYAVRTEAHGISAVVINGVGAIPTDRSGRIHVRFGPHADERFVSAADVLSGEVGAERLAGRLVLVGASVPPNIWGDTAISGARRIASCLARSRRSEEHTSELQSLM